MKIEDKRLLTYLNVVIGKETFTKLYTKNGEYVKSDYGRYSWKRDKYFKWVEHIIMSTLKNGFTENKKGNNFRTITNKGLVKIKILENEKTN